MHLDQHSAGRALTGQRPHTGRAIPSLHRTTVRHPADRGAVRPSERTRSGRALLLEGIHRDAETVLADAGFDVDRRAGALDEDELVAAVRDVDVLGVRSGTRVTRRVLDAAGRLQAIGAFCIGTDQVDLSAATQRGVAVFNAPFSNTRSVVELAVAEMIALTRRLPVRDAAMHAGIWNKSSAGSHEVRGRCLGIVGYGNIGSQLSVLAEALGMSVVFHDTADRLPRGNARRCDSLEELLAVADVVSLHVDGRPANADLFGERQFAAMRPGAVFLNLSRGFVVDHDALRRHVLTGHVAGAAIDVFPSEPRRSGERFDSVLRGLPNVVLTPHIGGSTEEAQQDIGVFVAGKLRDHARRGETASSVNLPHVSLPEAPGTGLLRVLHRNAPEVLGSVDDLLAACAANGGQRAEASGGQIRYLLCDVPPSTAADLAVAVAGIPGVIRARVAR